MNGRGQYGIPLYGGSLYSAPPWGGAPDQTSWGWAYHGPRAFHGHEAPSFGRCGSWPPRREAPLGRGGLVVGDATNGRGSYGAASSRWGAARMGNVLYHSVGDIEDAVKQLAADYDAAYGDIGHQVGVLPYEGSAERVKKHPDWYVWWTVSASPLFDRFVVFRHEMLGGDRTFADSYIAYTNRMKVTSWTDEIVSWHDKLVDLRNSAKRMGMRFTSPEPAKPASTLPEEARDLLARGAKKLGGEAWDVWKIVKYGSIAALSIGAVVALSSVVTNLRKGDDPAQKWLEYAGRGARRGAEAAAL